MIQIKPLEKTSDCSWALMPMIIRRIVEFCERYATDIQGDAITQGLASHFISDNPTAKAWAVMDDAEIIGHAVVMIEEIHGIKALSFLQWEMDERIEREPLREAFGTICDFGKKHGATIVQMSTANERLQQMYEREWGFRTHRIIMRRPLQ